MKFVSALSVESDPESAVREVVERAAEALEGTPGDLAVVFASADHAESLAGVSAALRARGLARVVIGCTGESIAGDGVEVEGSSALSLWVAQLPGVSLQPLRLTFDGPDVIGWPPAEVSPDASGPPVLLLLGDPFSFPTDHFLKKLQSESAGVRVVGGMASASQVPGGNRLVLDDGLFDNGAVALAIRGPVSLHTVVSQGCRPIGRTMVVTRAEKNVIRELGRRPALEVLRETFEELPPDDQALVQEGLHIGRVISEYQETFRPGDFLVRNVLGADDAGGIAITDLIKVGQTVQFHVRDATSADADLDALLERERAATGSGTVRGALLFSCNGRGTRLFSGPNHDVQAVQRLFGPVPVAGFFAMGEIGPVGGQNFVHGYTASLLLFGEPPA